MALSFLFSCSVSFLFRFSWNSDFSTFTHTQKNMTGTKIINHNENCLLLEFLFGVYIYIYEKIYENIENRSKNWAIPQYWRRYMHDLYFDIIWKRFKCVVSDFGLPSFFCHFVGGWKRNACELIKCKSNGIIRNLSHWKLITFTVNSCLSSWFNIWCEWNHSIGLRYTHEPNSEKWASLKCKLV